MADPSPLRDIATFLWPRALSEQSYPITLYLTTKLEIFPSIRNVARWVCHKTRSPVVFGQESKVSRFHARNAMLCDAASQVGGSSRANRSSS